MKKRAITGRFFERTQGINQGLSQVQIIALGFFLIILAGSLLLMLPFSCKGEICPPLTAVFTATSATCVTGLVVTDTFRSWTLFGQLVILTLIQVGGLGFVTLSVVFSIYIRRNITLQERGLLQESNNTLEIAGVVKLAKMIVKGTALIEGAGAVLLSVRFIPRYGFVRGIYYSIFHSVSAFCNGGFDLMGETESYLSLCEYSGDVLVNVVIMLLILVGGIGFIVWRDVVIHGTRVKKYMLHTKIVLTATFFLVFGSAVLFWLFEKDNLMAGMGVKESVLASLFSAVTARTAGFNTIDTGSLSNASKLLTMVLMFIGGCTGSTAGGIKTTTIVVLLLYVVSSLRNRGCNIFGRRISDDIIKKASMVFMINLALAVTAGIAVCGLHPEIAVNEVLFEVFSAIGTAGMTTGITRQLGTTARIILILLMYCGRIGSMTFAMTFASRKNKYPVQYPVEKITVG